MAASCCWRPLRRVDRPGLETGKDPESDQELLVKQDAYSGEKAKSLKAAEPAR
jgi:hypothetical protein